MIQVRCRFYVNERSEYTFFVRVDFCSVLFFRKNALQLLRGLDFRLRCDFRLMPSVFLNKFPSQHKSCLKIPSDF